MKAPVVAKVFKRHTVQLLKDHIEACKHKTSTFWLGDYDNIWPEADGSLNPLEGRRHMNVDDEQKEVKDEIDSDNFERSGDSDDNDDENGDGNDLDDSDGDDDGFADHSFGERKVISQLDSVGVLSGDGVDERGADEGEPDESEGGSEYRVDDDNMNELKSVGLSSVRSNFENQFLARSLQNTGKRKRKGVDRGLYVD